MRWGSWRRIWRCCRLELSMSPAIPTCSPTAVARKAKKPKKPRGNAPAMDLAAELKRISGVDLTSIDGIDVMGAQTILSELGTDLTAFATEHQFASRLG